MHRPLRWYAEISQYEVQYRDEDDPAANAEQSRDKARNEPRCE